MHHYTMHSSQHEAAKTMQDAINEFSGTPEEVRLASITDRLYRETYA